MRNYLRIVIAFVAALILAYALRDLEDQPWGDLEDRAGDDEQGRADYAKYNYHQQHDHTGEYEE